MKIFNLTKEEIEKQTESTETKIAVVGFGYVGLSIGALLSKNNRVTAIDVNKNVIEKINKGVSHINEPGVEPLLKKAVEEKRIFATDDINFVAEADVILITVGTPLNDKYEPNLDYIKKVAENLGPLLKQGDIVILKSTVTPGTTEDVVKKILEEKSNLKAGEDFGLAFCPERLAEGSAIKDLEKLPIVIGGINEKSSEKSAEFWESNGFTTVKVSSAKTAEMTKLADNLWIDLNISLGNEIAKLSEKLNVNAVEVIEAANTLPKGKHMVNILYPGSGVGGSCLVKDPWFVYHIGKKYGLESKTPKTSREINESMPSHLFGLVKEAFDETGKNMENSKVVVLGLAFKGGTGDMRSTPAKPLIDLLKQSNCNIVAYDPWVEKSEAKSVTENIIDNMEDALSEADCVIIQADHPEFREIDIEKMKTLMKTPCVVDGRDILNEEKLKKHGFIYRGIGKGR